MIIRLSRIFDSARLLATDTGQQISELIDAYTVFQEAIIRALRNNLTFRDNFNADVTTLTLMHNKEQVVSTNGTVVGVFPIKVSQTSTLEMISSFGFSINSSGNLVVKAKFDSASATQNYSVTLVILYQ